MSDSEHSTVTYTSISSDYEEPSDVGSLGVVVYRYDGLPMHPPSPDYVPEPEHPPSPDYGPAHQLHMSMLPYPLPDVVSPTADLPGYISESDPEEDPEEENNEDPKEDPTDYLANIDDDEEEESSEDDADDDEKDEDEEEEERLALDDFVLPSQTSTYGARITVQPQPPMAASTKALIAAVAATLPLPSPPPSPLISYSSPLPQIPSPPFLVPLPPTTSPTYTEVPLGYKAVGDSLKELASTTHPYRYPHHYHYHDLLYLPCTRASMVMMRAAAPSTYV
ncbi:hypothetical protein Tco_0154352 [Tanacetum coccineum]